MATPKRKKPKAAKRKTVAAQPLAPVLPPVATVECPAHWWTEAFYKNLSKAVRPASSLSRRKMIVMRMPMPLSVFEDVLQDLPDGCADGLTRVDGVLQPTKKTWATSTFHFLIKNMSTIDKLFALQKADVKPGGRGRPLKAGMQRGKGASRLQLGVSAQRRGRKALLLSSAVGYASVKLVASKVKIPTLTMTWLNATMDQNGHVTWPTQMDPRARAACRKAMRRNLQLMLRDADFPTHAEMEKALTQTGSDSVLDLVSIRAAADAAQAARFARRDQ